MMIGIDPNTGLVYQGESYYGHPVWPSPVLSLATIVSHEGDFTRVPSGTNLLHADLLFREDSFDPVTRVRRGRLYKTPGNQPQQWHVTPHFFSGGPVRAGMQLHGFDSNFMAATKPKLRDSLLVLGTTDTYTIWRVVDIERIVGGEDLITLRGRTSLAGLPRLNGAAVPELGREKVAETLDKLDEAAFRAGPESVVDRARDVAQWSIGTWLAARTGDASLRLVDLWQLAGKVSEKDSTVIKNVGQTLARLHARNKPNVHEELGTRPVTEEDAEYTLAAVGILLRELGWAR
jgi:hypothetical protein